ncbi:MAG: GDSL-type esterase/lipase family protein [Planctomycetota bacterium]|jgi:lysophospholipase L1-like esterase
MPRFPSHVFVLLLGSVGFGTCWSQAAFAGDEPPPSNTNVVLRGSFDNARFEFEQRKRGHVVFMGGSITEMEGYRPMVCNTLRKRFPDTEFRFTDAGIASTCSTTGAFRLESDVLRHGPVDLFFVEFAVNDDQDAGHARRECIRGMEGIIRHARRHNPAVDVVVTYFVNPGMLETLQSGETPLAIGGHEEVVRHYGVSAIHLAKEVAERITAGTLTWKQFGGTHPAPAGNAVCAGMIDTLLDQAWSEPLPPNARKTPHRLPDPIDPLHYGNGRFVDPASATAEHGWTLDVPDWSKLDGRCRSRFSEIPMLWADRPGAGLSLEFTGTAVGAYVVAGPYAGIVETRVDGGPPKRIDLFHRFSAGLHYPRTVMFATDLKPGRHTLQLQTVDKTRSAGHAVRIMQFVAN